MVKNNTPLHCKKKHMPEKFPWISNKKREHFAESEVHILLGRILRFHIHLLLDC